MVISVVGVVAALRHRDLTGQGQRVQTSLLSTGLTLANQLVSWFGATDPPLEEAFNQDLLEAQSRSAGYEEQRALYEKHFLRGAYGNIYFRHYRDEGWLHLDRVPEPGIECPLPQGDGRR